MDPALQELLRADDMSAASAADVEAIVRLRHVGVTVPYVRFVARFGHIATCRIPAKAVRAVWRHPGVASLKAARTLNPDHRPNSVPDDLASRARDVRRPSHTRLTGTGAVVGIVDWGLDIDHPSFRHADGTTRVLALWDQRGAVGDSPRPYGYGQIHDRRKIDAALRSPHPYETLGYHPGDADRGTGSHGTHVADIAAGNGRAGGPSGIAPEAWLVFVHLADRGTGGLATLGDSVRLLEAVDYIRRVAGELELPWVINLSVGRHGGPHDGRTLVELAFDELLTAAPGRFIVQSAGNYRRARTHATGVVTAGEIRTLIFRTHVDDTTPNELEIWYSGEDELAVRLAPPDAPAGRWVRLGTHSPVTVNGATVGWLYHRASDPNNHDHHIDAFLSPSAPAGTWRVSLRAEHVANGRFHAWLERDDRCARCQTRFAPNSSDTTTTIGTIANGRIPLVVGAYNAHDAAAPVAPFSSSGPTRDRRLKPDCLAPGVDVLAARSARPGSASSSGLLVRKSGTSMAAPHVTGAVALCLQATAGRLTARDIRQLVLRTTRPTTSTSQEARTVAGYLDIPRLLAAVQCHQIAFAARHQPEERAMHVDSAAPLPATASHTFRELLYRPHSDLARLVRRHLEVLGRPCETVTGQPHPGDLLLEVPVGRPGPGICTVLEHRYAAPRRLGPGQLLLHPRADQDSADTSLKAPSAEEESAPAHVRKAQRLWAALFAGSSTLLSVKIEDLSRAPSPIIAASDFSAWTNSPDAVYVRDLGKADDAVWEAVLYHESLHVKQYRAAGGKRPANYATMMRYEHEAYTESARWVAARKRADPNDVAGQMRATAMKLRDEIRHTKRATRDPTERERRYRKFLIEEELLPQHKDIPALYNPAPRRRTGGEELRIRSSEEPSLAATPATSIAPSWATAAASEDFAAFSPVAEETPMALPRQSQPAERCETAWFRKLATLPVPVRDVIKTEAALSVSEALERVQRAVDQGFRDVNTLTDFAYFAVYADERGYCPIHRDNTNDARDWVELQKRVQALVSGPAPPVQQPGPVACAGPQENRLADPQPEVAPTGLTGRYEYTLTGRSVPDGALSINQAGGHLEVSLAPFALPPGPLSGRPVRFYRCDLDGSGSFLAVNRENADRRFYLRVMDGRVSLASTDGAPAFAVAHRVDPRSTIFPETLISIGEALDQDPPRRGSIRDLLTSARRHITTRLVAPYLLQREHLPLAQHQIAFLIERFNSDEWTSLLRKAVAATGHRAAEAAERERLRAAVDGFISRVINDGQHGVAKSDYTLARAIVRKTLSETGFADQNRRQSNLDWLQMLSNLTGQPIGADSVLGVNPSAQTTGIYEYDVSLDVAEAAVFLGGGFGKLIVKQVRPTAWSSAIELRVWFASVGGSLKVGTDEFHGRGSSVLPWSERDFIGRVERIKGGVDVSAPGASAGVSAGFLNVYGSEALPPMVVLAAGADFSPSPIEFERHQTGSGPTRWKIKGGLGISAGVHGLMGWSSQLDHLAVRDVTTVHPATLYGVAGQGQRAVHFCFDSALLTPAARQSLHVSAALWRPFLADPRSTLSITGFADQAGSDAYNKKLSKRRAQNTLQALRDILGSDLVVSDISIKGQGETGATGGGVRAGAADRRVEILLNGLTILTLNGE
jgi:subtilisin family serine protease